MENSDKEYLLDKFLKNQLTADEQQQWNILLKEDQAFREQAFFEKNVKKALIRSEREELKSFLKSIEIPEEKKPFRWRAIAASFIGFVAVISIAFFLFREKPSEKLYLSYYQPYPNVIAPAVRGEADSTSTAKAFEAYDTENYELSAQLFDRLYESDKLSFALLYAGISYLEIGKTDKATDRFLRIRLEKNELKDAAQWYLALTLLRENKRDFAEEYLKDLSKRDTEFSGQARALLEEI